MRGWTYVYGIVGLVALTTPSSKDARASMPPPNGWVAVTTGDFNGDGLNDILWSNAAMKQMAVWLMNGTQLLAAGPVLTGPLDEGWAAVQVGDGNLDGLADAVWYNATNGRFLFWLMNGTQLLAAGPEIQGPQGGGWSIGSVTDFNRDGMNDVLFVHRQTAQVTVWLMNGAHLMAPGPLVSGPDDL